MFTIDDNRIYLTRGDTADIAVSLKNLDDSDYEMQDGDTLYFRMKRYATKDASDILVEKIAEVTEDEVIISLVPTDTLELAFGVYRYEVELVTYDDKHYTVIADTEFEVGKELENH